MQRRLFVIESDRLLKFVQNNDLHNVSYLVDRGSPIDKKALNVAFNNINYNTIKYKMIKYLLKKNNSIDLKNYALFLSAMYNHIDLVRYLIEKNADIHFCNNTSLIWSAINGNIKITTYLLMKGADIHAKKDTTIIKALENNHIDMVKYLLQEGADIKVLSVNDQIKYKYYCSVKIMIFLLDFYYKRETEFSKNKLADINILSIVFSFH